MGIKVIKSVFELRDNFSTKLNSISKNSNKSLKDMKKEFNSLRNSMNKIKATAKKVFSSIKKYALIGITAIGAGTIAFLKKSNEAFNLQEEQFTKLRSVMANTKGVTKEQVEGLIEYADALEATGVIGNEVIIAGTQQISTYQLQADTLKKLMPGLSDLIAQQKGINATTQDAVGYGNLIGKVMMGQTSALSRAGINFTKAQEKILKFGTESEKAATLAEVLKQNVGGVNKALAETPQGQMAQINNAIDEVAKKLGSKVQPIINKVLKKLIENLPKIEKSFDTLLDGIDKMVPAIADGLSTALEFVIELILKFAKFVNFVGENWNWIKPTLISLMGFAGVVKIIMGIVKLYTLYTKALALAKALDTAATVTSTGATVAKTATTTTSTLATIASTVATGFATVATTALSAAVWVLTTAFAVLSSPIILIIAALAALVGVGYLVYKNFDKIKSAVSSLWDSFKETTFVKTLISWFEKLKEFIVDLISKVKDFGSEIKNGIKNLPLIGRFFGNGQENNSSNPVPKNALGTTYFKGGLTSINERGGEIVRLPNGTEIIPHDVSVKKVNSNSNSNVNVTVNIQGNVLGNDEYANYLASEIVKKVTLVRGNI